MPILETKRLILRPLQARDAEAYFELRAYPEVSKYLTRGRLASVEDAATLLATFVERAKAGTLHAWALTLREADRLLGTVGVPVSTTPTGNRPCPSSFAGTHGDKG